MRKRYCSPVTESICIETYMIAASAPAARMDMKPGGEDTDLERGIWGNIWE